METDIQLVDDPALNNISSINTRQTLLIVNDFIAHTVDFMNKFVTISEQKLYQINQKTEKLDILISLLEAKLESIPLHETDYRGTGTSTQAPAASQQSAPQTESAQQQPPPPSGQPPPPPPPQGGVSSSSGLSAAAEQALAQMNAQAEASQAATAAATPASPTPAPTAGALIESSGGLIKDDPRYQKYFSMLARGVPLPAVVQKMTIEGEGTLDTSIINLDPNTPVSATGLAPIVDGDDSD